LLVQLICLGMENFEDKIYILNEKRENLSNENNNQISLKEYVEIESQTDPDFFRSLFDINFKEDYNLSLNDQQRTVFQSWLNTL
jgi:hypothetical protein